MSPDGPLPTASPPMTSAGTYTYALTVTGPFGTDTDDVTITVTEPSTPDPVADAGPDQALEISALPVTLDGSTSSGASSLTYAWAEVGGGFTSTAATPSPPISGSGVFTYTLTVTDESGATDTDGVTVTVTGARLPTVTADLIPGAKVKHNKGLFTVQFTCSDPTVSAVLNGVTVTNGQTVDLRLKSGRSAKSNKSDKSGKSGKPVKIHGNAADLVLVVVCGPDGNTVTAEASPVFAAKSERSAKSKKSGKSKKN